VEVVVARFDQNENAGASAILSAGSNNSCRTEIVAYTKLATAPGQQSVRIVLQDRESYRYFKSGTEWTQNINEANDFRHFVLAMDFVRTARLPNIDVLVFFANPVCDLRLWASP
jgi:hypothetical protein